MQKAADVDFFASKEISTKEVQRLKLLIRLRCLPRVVEVLNSQATREEKDNKKVLTAKKLFKSSISTENSAFEPEVTTE